MDPVRVIVIISAGAVLFSLIGAALRVHPSMRSKTGETIEDRVGKLTKALSDATALIDNIEHEIKARSTLASQLQNDIDQYTKLVEVRKPEVEAIAQLLRGELKKEVEAPFGRVSLLISFSLLWEPERRGS
jgi:peptidoglycan hydrolase CwlO-like protein